MLPQYSLIQLSLSKTFNKYVVGEYNRTTLAKKPSLLITRGSFSTVKLLTHNRKNETLYFYEDSI